MIEIGDGPMPDLVKVPYEQLGAESTERVLSLQRSYAFLSDVADISVLLARVPSLQVLLEEAVEPLNDIFGQGKFLQLEALTSDDDSVLRVVVKLSKGTPDPAGLMRRFKQEWWLRKCSQSEASLVFDYEIGNAF